MALTFQEFGAMVKDWYTNPQSLPIAYTVTGLAAALVLAIAITLTILIRRHKNNKIIKVEELPKQEEKPKPTIEQKGAKEQQQIVINMPIHQTTTINQAPEIIDDARNVSEALTNVVTILEKVNTAVETRDIVYLSPILESSKAPPKSPIIEKEQPKQKPQTPIINNIINIPQLPNITQIIAEAKDLNAFDLLADF